MKNNWQYHGQNNRFYYYKKNNKKMNNYNNNSNNDINNNSNNDINNNSNNNNKISNYYAKRNNYYKWWKYKKHNRKEKNANNVEISTNIQEDNHDLQSDSILNSVNELTNESLQVNQAMQYNQNEEIKQTEEINQYENVKQDIDNYENVDSAYTDGSRMFENILEDEEKEKSYFEKKPMVGYVLGVAILVVMLFGVTYAYFSYFKSDTRQADIIAGEVYVKVKENNLPLTLSISNLYPKTKEEARESNNNYVDFTIIGKNTSLNNSVLYKFLVLDGEDVNGKTRINPDYLLFDLATVDVSGNETILIDSATANEFNNIDLDYVNYVANGTNTEQEVKYRLRAWISDKLLISDSLANKTYTTSQFANLYANIKLKISTELTAKSIPLIIMNNKANTASGRSVIETQLTNYYDLNLDGESLDTADVIKYQVSDSTNSVYFRYSDSRGANIETNQNNLDLTYNFTQNESVTHSITFVSRSGQNISAPITYKVYKNNRLIKEYTQTVSVIGESYCISNGFDKLADCILVSENNYNSVSLAKNEIASKGDINTLTTAPAYSDSGHTTIDLVNSQKGLYAVNDTQGTSYIYRGNVTTNNVSFANLMWKIIRINGDGSIRLIYNDDITNLSTIAYNNNLNGPTYVGYMYNEESTPWESSSFEKNDFDVSTSYYWGDGYNQNIDTNGAITYTLKEVSQNMVASTFAAMKSDYDTNGANSQIMKTPYTCLKSNSTDACDILYQIVSITGTSTANVKIVTMSPNSQDKGVVNANIKSSNIKDKLEAWYNTTFTSLSNNNIPVTNYVVDNVWCNDRSTSDSGTSPSLVTVYNTKIRADNNDNTISDQPNLLCTNASDRFSYSVNNGNGKLLYPVGLITLDEVILAGGEYTKSNGNYYLNSASNYWTMSPGIYNTTSFASNFVVGSNGSVNAISVNETANIRPVINLSKNTMITGGNGEIGNPFIIK